MKRGIPISLFVTEPTKDFVCGICYDVLRNPHQCPNGHCFCSDCILMALDHKCACPNCAVKLPKEALGRNLLIASLIERMPVTCGCPDVFSEFGLKSTCTWSGPFEERPKHIATCPETLVDCPLSTKNLISCCKGKVLRKDLHSHLLSVYQSNPELMIEVLDKIQNTATYEGYTGDLKDGRREGQGVMRDNDGSTYSGDWQNGLRSGYGVYRSKQGDTVYHGQFEADLPHGRGVLKQQSNGFVEYDGEFIAGKRQGKGTQVYSDTRGTYVGEWLDDKRHGHGMCTRANGMVYTGSFLCDKYHGKGTVVFPSGARYEGEFADGVMCGRGVYTHASGAVYEGNFRNDASHGYGYQRYANGTTYQGEWVEDRREGHGRIVHPDKSTYTGYFQNDVYSGHGASTCEKSGVSYTGQWLAGKRSGFGVQVTADGTRFEGEWSEDRRVGSGKIFDSNGGLIKDVAWAEVGDGEEEERRGGNVSSTAFTAESVGGGAADASSSVG